MQRKNVLAAGEVKGLYRFLIDVHNTNKLLNGTVTVARIVLDTEVQQIAISLPLRYAKGFLTFFHQ